MILGVGHDLAYLPRFVELLRTRSPRRIARLSTRILHPTRERPRFDAALANATGDTDTEGSTAGAAKVLATAWSCKEALFKSLDAHAQRHCRFNEWYRAHSSEGRPLIANEQYMAANPHERFHLSVSHDGEYVSAFVVRSQVSGNLQ